MTSTRLLEQSPLVSIGVPARNGGELLAEALDLLIHQTYRNIEIIISDNASTDETSEIVASFARRDSRIRAFRQEVLLTAIDNFRFVFEQSTGEFFMWAACDDRRSLDYVEQLQQAMAVHPGASLAFGEVAEMSDLSTWREAQPFPYQFESQPTDSLRDRLTRYTRINCLHIYGLIRSQALASYRWIDIESGPDIPLLVHLSIAGSFIRAAQGRFYYHVPLAPKTLEERARVNSLRKVRRFQEVRLAWACGQTAHRAGSQYGLPVGRLYAFLTVYANRHWRWIKPRLFEASPAFLVALYRRVFKRERV